LYMLALRGGAALGSLVTGTLIHFVGVRYALAVDGAAAIVAQALIAQHWHRGDVERVS
jgi:hypothetical protein